MAEQQMSFGKALKLLKAGRLITRMGWHGQWLNVVNDPPRIGVRLLHVMEPMILRKTVAGTLEAWCPTQYDILAEDWLEHGGH